MITIVCTAIVQPCRFSLFGYIARMPDETDAKKMLTAFLLGELEETTRTPSNYVDEAYLA